MGDALTEEGGGVVRLGLIEADDVGDAELAEYRGVVFRREGGAVEVGGAAVGGGVEGALEGDELGAEDMDVAVRRAVQEVVLAHVEGVDIKPSELDGLGEAFEAFDER